MNKKSLDPRLDSLPQFRRAVSIAADESLGDLRALGESPEPTLLQPSGGGTCRLIALKEINEEAPTAYREAITNVVSALDAGVQVSLIYILEGTPNGVGLYFGLLAGAGVELHYPIRNLRCTLEGQLPGVAFGDDREGGDVLQRLEAARHVGAVFGVPTPQREESSERGAHSQGIERLVRNLLSSGLSDGSTNPSCWQIVLVAEPIPRQATLQRLDLTLELQSRLAMLSRASIQASSNESDQRSTSTGTSTTEGSNHSKTLSAGKNESATEGKNWGTSSSGSSSSTSSNSGGSQSKTIGTNEGQSTTKGTSHSATSTENLSLSKTRGNSYGITQELANKSAQLLHDRIEKEIVPRLEQGQTKGLFRCGLYIAGENKATYDRLRNAVRATFQGSEATMSPLWVRDLPEGWKLSLPALPRTDSEVSLPAALLHSLDVSPLDRTLGNIWNATELALIAGLPQRELPGIRRRKTVSFAIDLPKVAEDQAIDLGPVIDIGKRYPMHPARLNREDLNKHLFITGVTGAGKTTTCLKLLKEAELPFLVIEPAKTEYRALAAHFAHQIDFYRPNGDPQQSLRINPFALVRRGQRIRSHAGFLKNVFATIFPLEASMPQMVEAAILAAYEEKGWDTAASEWLGEGDPFEPLTRAWPTLSDMVRQLDKLIPSYGLGREFEEKYRGSLVSRLRGLTDGTLGGILDVPQSIDWQALLKRKAVIELEELQSGEEKALMMALILGATNEAIRDHYRENPGFRHLTLIEEAHRLLARPEPGDTARALAVEAFADMLAEVRKYGEGLIIADQIPAKLIPDVIKNTHTKVVHRLFAEDDRRAMAEAMMMSEAQRDYLPNLATGEAVIYCGGWHAPAHAQIDRQNLRTDGAPLDEDALEARYIEQLWRERYRYYPELCRVMDDTKDADHAAAFAQSVKRLSQALSALLRMLESKEEPRRLERSFASLKKNIDALCGGDAGLCPQVAALFAAFLLDANLRPRAEAKNPPPLLEDRSNGEERQQLNTATQELLRLVAAANDAKTLRAALTKARESPQAAARALCNFLLDPLAHYRTI
ncbi:MAG: ATP-binding protein [Halothiobacillaceae bacterium]